MKFQGSEVRRTDGELVRSAPESGENELHTVALLKVPGGVIPGMHEASVHFDQKVFVRRLVLFDQLRHGCMGGNFFRESVQLYDDGVGVGQRRRLSKVNNGRVKPARLYGSIDK